MMRTIRGDWLLRALGRGDDYNLDGEVLMYEPRYYACGKAGTQDEWIIMDRTAQKPVEMMSIIPLTRRQAEEAAAIMERKWREAQQ